MHSERKHIYPIRSDNKFKPVGSEALNFQHGRPITYPKDNDITDDGR